MSIKLLKSSTAFSFMTFISRIFGFIRDMVIAYFFGASHGLDAFILAFKIPNMMRRLFAEGAFSQAFVPIISEYKAKNSQEEVRSFIDNVAGCLFIVLVIVTFLGIIFAPFIIKAFAPGFDSNGVRVILAIDMLKITFPYMLLISLTAFLSGILNSYGKFAAPAFTPVFLNLSMIIAAIFFSEKFAQPEMVLAWGIIFGGIIQLLFQIPFLMKINLIPKPKINFNHPGVRRIMILMGPALLGAAVSQINSIIDTLFASFLQAGSISWLYFADRLMEFPLGIFGVGFATVVLPSLSREFTLTSKEKFSEILDWGIRWVLLTSVPAVAGLYFLAGPLIVTLFKSGKFSINDVMMSKNCLMAYSLAVVGIMLAKVFSCAFYARQDIKTPVKIAVFVIICNIVLNAILIGTLQHVGLALSTSISSSINACMLFFILNKRGIYTLSKGSLAFFARILFATIMMIFIINNLTPSLDDWMSWGLVYRGIILIPLVLLSVFIYVITLFSTGLRSKHVLKQNL